MGKLTNLNPATPIADADLPASIARDAEYIAADTAHVAHANPHPVYVRLDLPPTYGSLIVNNSKGGYAGFTFSGGFNAPVLMIDTGAWQNGMWSAGAAAGWMWQYNNGWYRVFNPNLPTPSQTTRGVHIGFDKSFGSLPGYPNDDYPTLKTDYSDLYFSIGNVYSARMTAGGTLVAVSDKNKKKNAIEIDYFEFLDKLKKIPIYRYSFLSEPDSIQRCGPYAQDFYALFRLGGDEIEGPNNPETTIAPMDAIGVLLAAVKALSIKVERLESVKK